MKTSFFQIGLYVRFFDSVASCFLPAMYTRDDPTFQKLGSGRFADMADDSELLFAHFIGESVPIDRFVYFHLKTPHKQILSRKKSAAFVYCHKGLELLSSVRSSAQRAIFSANQGRTEKTFEPRKMGVSGKINA